MLQELSFSVFQSTEVSVYSIGKKKFIQPFML